MLPADLPLITADLPGTGGLIKVEPDHFIVEEVPLYTPSGDGDHLFVAITRAGRTTRQVVDDLAGGLGVAAKDIGYAGLKDRQARTTQVFSVPGVQASQVESVADALDLELRWMQPNARKLKTGHLLGNQFTITVLQPEAPDALERAQIILAALAERGLPNYFGSQRFGRFGDNAEQGLGILTGQRRRPGAQWLHHLLTSAYQSQLFNEYLAKRIRRGQFDQILGGDLVKKTDTGGMFVVEDVDVEQPRFDRGEITFTGPLFGYEMRRPEGAAAALEARIEATSPVTSADWKRHRVSGNRRPGRLFLQTIEIEPNPQGFILRFFLPKGAYATILLREVMKTDPGLLDDES
ncbi:MAG: tRNA pseudouridine(13) synthase TruD [Caldilineales bacterium]|nr:tRNA pseudouridine(13) synthase TruD [Caldilineales bacterium]